MPPVARFKQWGTPKDVMVRGAVSAPIAFRLSRNGSKAKKWLLNL
jgi:hypothetical protein